MSSVTDTLLRLVAICAAILGLAAHYAWGDVMNDSIGRFSVDFPGRAQSSSQNVTTQAGTVVAHIFSYRSMGGSTYTVVYSDYPDGSMAKSVPDSVYEGVINGAMGQTGGTLKSSTTTQADGVAGREAVFESPDHKSALKTRYFLAGDRLYQIAYEGSPGSESGKDATAFFNSFHIRR